MADTGEAGSEVGGVAGPRVPLVSMADADEAQAELFAALGGDEALNLFRALANHPKLMRSWLRFGAQLPN